MFPDEFPSKLKRSHVNPDEVALGIADLEPFSENERKIIVDKMAENHYIAMDEDNFRNRIEGNGEVKLDEVQIRNLKNYLDQCIKNKVKEVYFVVKPEDCYDGYNYVSSEEGQTFLVVGAKSDNKKLNKNVIHALRHIIEENRKYQAERDKNDQKLKEKTNKLRKLFDALQDKSMSFEEFQKESNGLLEYVKFIEKTVDLTH
jgi:hypothetical protein